MDNGRTQWAARMLALLEPLKSRLPPGGSGFALGATAAHYETATIPMEAFSRPLWALVPFWAGGVWQLRESVAAQCSDFGIPRCHGGEIRP